MGIVKKSLALILIFAAVLLFFELRIKSEETRTALLDEIKNPVSLLTKDKPPGRKSAGWYLDRVEKRNVFQPVARQFLEEIRPKWSMRLTGTIVAPGQPSAAFIIDPSGKEGLYYEGDKLAGGVVKSIQSDQVIWSDGAGNNLILKIGEMNPISESVASPKTTDLTETISSFSLEGVYSKSALEIARQLKPIIATLSPEVIRQRINEITGIEVTEIPAEGDLTEYVTRLIQVSQDGLLEDKSDPKQISALRFSTVVNPDNSVQNPATQFSQSDKRIYAGFSNEGNLKGIKTVVTRWTLIPEGAIIYLGNKTVNPEATNNHVWVEKKDGFAKGAYQVEIFKPGDMTKAAVGRFEVK